MSTRDGAIEALAHAAWRGEFPRADPASWPRTTEGVRNAYRGCAVAVAHLVLEDADAWRHAVGKRSGGREAAHDQRPD